MPALTISRKLGVILGLSGILLTVCLAIYLAQSSKADAQQRAKTSGMELIGRSAEMFMVSTRKFHNIYTNASTDVQKKGALDDWNRTILAVDTAVINDFGSNAPRIRLIGDLGITGVKPLGTESIRIQTPFEERALKEIMAGKEKVEELSDDYYRLAVPLLNSMHPGCAECHGISTSGRIVMGSVNAYIPLRSEYAEARKRALHVGMYTGFGVLLLLALIGYSLNRFLVKPVTKVAETLSLAADQATSSASQVSAASQSLAEGASEQAASLEETGASLEEMASMTKRNADSARQANELARAARAAADKGAHNMEAMSRAMDEIKTSSDDVAKIIKTIDQIAFQTNILALNAAVEAARAGDAGMGFAVVADEVRNLAQRSAQAAKETAAKIEGAISKTSQGVGISAQVLASLQEIVATVKRLDELVSEVATASSEQNQGIGQLNTAVNQMDQVTQANAANAEESASAATELSSQAEHLREAVAQLLNLVQDNTQREETGTTVLTAASKSAALAAGTKALRRSSAPLSQSQGQFQAAASRNGTRLNKLGSDPFAEGFRNRV